MALPHPFPATDATLDSLAFWEVDSDGRYAGVATEGERIIVGQTVIRRYRRPRTATIRGICAIADADDFDNKEGSSASLTWHRGTQTVYVDQVETAQIDDLAVAEITLSVIL